MSEMGHTLTPSTISRLMAFTEPIERMKKTSIVLSKLAVRREGSRHFSSHRFLKR